jgi:uncharacterized membrane protein YhiD involved in acid resistance
MRTGMKSTQPLAARHHSPARMLAGLFLLTVGLVGVGSWWAPSVHAFQPNPIGDGQFPDAVRALTEGARLLIAAVIGLLIGYIQRGTRHDQPLSRSMAQAHVLLCVAGALTMILIGDSVARAFGVAGAASIIRFRTPVDDPRDITVLFLLMALGMAAGLGLFAVAGVGTLFLGACLMVMDRANAGAPRSVKVALVAQGKTFPTAHVSRVFARHGVTVAPLEIFKGETATARYRAMLAADLSIEQLSADLLNGAEGADSLKSVSWEASKRGL